MEQVPKLNTKEESKKLRLKRKNILINWNHKD